MLAMSHDSDVAGGVSPINGDGGGSIDGTAAVAFKTLGRNMV